MRNFRIIPRLEIKSGNLIKGMRMEGLKILGDPLDFISKYYNDGADEIIIDDIVASLYSRKIDYNLIKRLSNEIHVPITISGGIKNINDIFCILESGADKVCINTNAILNPQLIYDAARIFGSQCITVGIQAKRVFENHWEAFTESGRNRSHKEIIYWATEVQDLGAGEIFFISIDNDGVEENIDFSIIRELKRICSVPLLVGGGIRDELHIKSLIDYNIDGCVMSKSLHYCKTEISILKNQISSKKVIIRK